MLKRKLFLFALCVIISQALFAQVTTSSISGVIKTGADEPLPGATVVATDLRSGTKYQTIARGGGQFTLANMQPGGPYTILVSYVGFDQESYEDIYLKLAENFIMNGILKKAAGTLENVILTTSRRNTILNPSRTSPITNISRRQIQQLPTVTRSINDYTRSTPQANGSSIAGGNFRQNNFTIDGADFNNSFGIGTNLPANGSPISIDALEEISINIAPFDVRQSGFIGSAINAVTRAGTNSFSGTAYHYYRTQRLRGNKVGKVTFLRPVEEFDQWGGSFGGPLIKNKLFFFMNYERESQPKSVQTRFAATVANPFGSAANISRPTRDSLDYISNYLKDVYDYDTGPYDNYTTLIERRKFLMRLDWNVCPGQRFNIRYSQVTGGEPFSPSTSVTGSGAVANPTRTDVTAQWYKNSNYYQGANFYSLAAELNSTFGKFANTFRGTYTYQNDSRSTDSKVFPFVDIMSSTGGVAPYTSFGFEPFSFGNLRQVKMYSVIDNFSFRVGKHSWMFGGQMDWSKTINGFQRFATTYYRFATWDDFVTAKKPTDFALTYSLLPGFPPVFSSFRFKQWSLYGQDEIAFNKDFRLTLGLRVDRSSYPSVPQILTHPLVLGLNFENGEKLNTGNLPSDKMVWSPRLGFNWDLYGNRSLQLRGGTGIFTGKVPFVWIVSQSGDGGMIQITQNFNSPSTVPGPFSPDPTTYRPPVPPVAGTIVPATVTVMAPNFKFPTTWKTSLGMDTKLPWGMVGSIDLVYNRDENTAFFRNPNLLAPSPLNVVGYPDNRMIYGATVPTRFINTLSAQGVPTAGGPSAFNPIVLDNGKKGYYFSATVKIEKPLSKGLSLMVAYTKSVGSNLFDGGGDQPLSAWQGTPTVSGSNFPVLGYANFVIPDRVVGNLTWRKEFFKHTATSIGLFYQGSIDGRFSYIYNGDLNRDGVFNDLIYIPKDQTEIDFGTANVTVNGITYTPQMQKDLFFQYIEQDKYLRAHKGQYAERNGAQVPWRNQLDVKFLQDFFVNIGKKRNTFQFSADIVNFGNLLTSKWGIGKTINNASILVLTSNTTYTPGGTVKPVFNLAQDRGNFITTTFRDNVNVFSTYFVQFGLRYIFN
ncbi:MAG TPA: TonB-dependent receptor [Chitinophagaceae bacterium]|nr:TonB-dependent receptor [Chitinophagaceae bacterium]